jgi:hypothetical protein
LLWGAFFLEHLQEWFLHPAKGFPPLWVWLAQLAHLMILVGLAALWRWRVAGSVLTIAGALCFFGGLAISQAAAGRQYILMLAFLAITIIPALLTLSGWLARTYVLAGSATPLARNE